MKTKIIFGLLILMGILLFAEDKYNEWLKKQKSQKQEYIKNENKSFSDFLKKDWEEFSVFNGDKLDKKPKPKVTPKAPSKSFKTPKVQVKKVEIKLQQTMLQEKDTLLLNTTFKPTDKTINIDFYNQIISITDFQTFNLIADKLSNKLFAQAWKKNMENNKFNQVINDITFYKNKLDLNDWALYSLLYKISEEKYDNTNERKLFIWIALNKLKYDCKIGYDTENIALIIPIKEAVYSVPFLNIEGKKYFLLSPIEENIKYNGIITYKDNNPTATKNLSLNLNRLPKFPKTGERKVSFDYQNQNYEITLKYNKDLIEFLKNYPTTSYSTYFNSPLYDISYRSIISQFKPILEGKTKAEALNILLRFVQKAFEYKIDEDQFGDEKCLFAEETLYYPANDCEDRSVIFSYLVRRILNLNVIGLDYPGHVATAVELNNVKGDYIKYNQKNYLICDPTYINANIGVSMPDFKEVSPKVIDIY